MSVIHPIHIRDFEIPTNIFFAPINPGLATNGIISDEYINFFVEHSGRGIGICYIGNVALQKEWSTNINTAIISETPKNRWIELSKRITEKGSIPGIQLAWKPPQLIPQKSFTNINKDRQIEFFRKFYVDFNDYDIVSNLFINNINYAFDSGFPVIQIHAAHGYALSLLLSRIVSGCDDPQKTKGAELIKRIMGKMHNENIIYDIRLSLYEGLEDNLCEIEYKTRLMEMLINCGFDMISLSNGFYNIDKTMIYPSKEKKMTIYLEAENYAKKYPSVVWNVSGNMENALQMDSSAPNNLTYSLGRQLLVDPDTVFKVKKQELYSIRHCSECNACHYYSYGYNGIQRCNSIKKQSSKNN